jgi:ATP phosphoribosyltransferase
MITLALPKGRLLSETLIILDKGGIRFRGNLETSRRLFHDSLDRTCRVLIIRARDVPTFVEYGGADAGVVGKDILAEDDPDVYEPLDLGFGYCRLVLAEPEERTSGLEHRSSLKVATKYPNITEKYFSSKGVQVEIIKLYGSIELAPVVRMADAIVDLASTGKTLRANRLVEIETVLESTARVILNRIAFKAKFDEVSRFLERIKEPPR